MTAQQEWRAKVDEYVSGEAKGIPMDRAAAVRRARKDHPELAQAAVDEANE